MNQQSKKKSNVIQPRIYEVEFSFQWRVLEFKYIWLYLSKMCRLSSPMYLRPCIDVEVRNSLPKRFRLLLPFIFSKFCGKRLLKMKRMNNKCSSVLRVQWIINQLNENVLWHCPSSVYSLLLAAYAVYFNKCDDVRYGVDWCDDFLQFIYSPTCSRRDAPHSSYLY